MMKDNRRNQQQKPQIKPFLQLTVSPVALGIVTLPGMASAGVGVVELVAAVDTTGLLAGSSETTGFAVLIEKKDMSVSSSSISTQYNSNN